MAGVASSYLITKLICQLVSYFLIGGCWVVFFLFFQSLMINPGQSLWDSPPLPPGLPRHLAATGSTRTFEILGQKRICRALRSVCGYLCRFPSGFCIGWLKPHSQSRRRYEKTLVAPLTCPELPLIVVKQTILHHLLASFSGRLAGLLDLVVSHPGLDRLRIPPSLQRWVCLPCLLYSFVTFVNITLQMMEMCLPPGADFLYWSSRRSSQWPLRRICWWGWPVKALRKWAILGSCHERRQCGMYKGMTLWRQRPSCCVSLFGKSELNQSIQFVQILTSSQEHDLNYETWFCTGESSAFSAKIPHSWMSSRQPALGSRVWSHEGRGES